MGEFKKYIARSFYFWMVRFLKTKYDNVKIVFISHHTEAKEVTEEQFFTQGESGGTVVSSAYRLAFDIIGRRYPPKDWNIYPFHFSDGDNYYSDNDEAVKLADELIGPVQSVRLRRDRRRRRVELPPLVGCVAFDFQGQASKTRSALSVCESTTRKMFIRRLRSFSASAENTCR